MVFKFFAEAAARRQEAAAQEEARSLVARITAFARNPVLPSSEDFVLSLIGEYSIGQAEDGKEVMAVAALRAFGGIAEQIYKDEITALSTPPPAPERMTSFDGEKFRAELHRLTARLDDPMALVDEM